MDRIAGPQSEYGYRALYTELRNENEERIHELESLIASYEEGDDLDDLSNQMKHDSLIWELEDLRKGVEDDRRGTTRSNLESLSGC